MEKSEKSSDHIAAVKTIQKKLLGKKLTYKEVYNLMDQISQQKLGDVLTAYFVAASFKDGFAPDELYYLTKAMVETGTQLHFKGIVADKHSTGGVAGTRTTMLVVPIIAAAGFKIPKTSSRAITTPAGTADVMETLSNVTFTTKQITRIVEDVGGCIVWGGHLGIAPADDIIIKIEEPLSFESFDKVIVSIMAKKIAASTTHLILDIPVGKTMKIKHFSDAEKVAEKFKSLGKKFGMKVIADVNETLEPAGRGIGPYLEAKDVLYVLEQKKERSLQLEAKALRLAGKLLDICFHDAKINKNGEDEAKRILSSGLALKKMKEIIKAQGGNEEVTSDNFKTKATQKEVLSTKSGTIKEINNYNLNTVAKILGAPADKFAGIYLLKKLDEEVKSKEPIVVFHSCDEYRIKEAKITLQNFPIYNIE